MKCGWRKAFIAQGKSDFEVFNTLRSIPVEPCHYLHYLQMAAEKIAKGLSCKDELPEPPRTHKILVKWMRQLTASKPHSDWLKCCRCHSSMQFKEYLDGLIGLASAIEALSPAMAGKQEVGRNEVGRNEVGRNVEYPWYDAITKQVRFPADCHYDDIIKHPKFTTLQEFMKASIKFAKLHP